MNLLVRGLKVAAHTPRDVTKRALRALLSRTLCAVFVLPRETKPVTIAGRIGQFVHVVQCGLDRPIHNTEQGPRIESPTPAPAEGERPENVKGGE